MYVILDIETTGGKFNEEGITEIAIYKFDGHDVVDQFISLVNPEKPIQEFVVKLTGINNKMLRNAPKFYEVAKRIVEITKDCIVVAHNAAFDYRILRTEFERLGFDFYRNTLCTVELSQNLIENQPSYSLGKLTKSLGIPITDRHRATGDALATVQLFKLLLEKDTEKTIIQNSVKYFDRRLEKEKLKNLIDEIPDTLGVYYVHDSTGKVIFIGKGKNIKAELNNLFIKTSRRAVKIQERASTVSFNKTGNELFTRLKYYLQLDKISPKFNFKKKLKINEENFNNDNFIIFDKGREVEEHAVILIENNIVTSYGYINLAHQENNLEILKSVLTKIENKEISKTIIKNYLKRSKVQKIIRF
ncbi:MULTISPECIES: exonuclease domain-containing protein [unclassified Polaribacter]|uniref:exonuclease domain-containing protein n=1 Tax=unclassified Polaribacter TaxID=196858 RepID=UPI0011BEAD79|nr:MULTISPECIES: exonuclease domain-containing protein [unclassified Polaribacter]TXD52519.1 DNA polymerase III subunit epsilon [Polaribacter sp. IC063]TXD60505.1 DNA polymerase III subunit epsilon [Polaribacter sp. IC066]